MTLYKWSQTASADATADSTINWAEGQAPSSVNDSARAMMAAVAKWRDDMGSNLQTAGTSTAYTLATNQVFDSLANMATKELSFFIHATNGTSPTLNVDGLGAYPIVIDGAANAVPAGTLIAGAIYTVVWSNSGLQFRLKDFYQLPFVVPVGGMIDYFGTTAPSSNFVFPYGQAISRATYATLFALTGTTYGTGDGSTTFNIPDLRGRIIAGKDDMGGSAASRVTTAGGGVDGLTLGAAGGGQNQTLTLAQLPTGIASSASNSISVTSTVSGIASNANINTILVNSSGTLWMAGNNIGAMPIGAITSTGSNSISVTSNNTSGNAHTIMQPTIVANKIMRIL